MSLNSTYINIHGSQPPSKFDLVILAYGICTNRCCLQLLGQYFLISYCNLISTRFLLSTRTTTTTDFIGLSIFS